MKKRLILICLSLGMLATAPSYADTIKVQFDNRTQYDFIMGNSSIHPPHGQPPREIKPESTTPVFTLTGEHRAPGGVVGTGYHVHGSSNYIDLDFYFRWDSSGKIDVPPRCLVYLHAANCVAEYHGDTYVLIIHYQGQKRK